MSKRPTLGKISMLLIVLAVLGGLAAAGYLAANPRTVFNRETIKQSPVLLALRNVKLSLIKLPDLIHLPYWFRKTQLETYTLEISRQNMAMLDANLPRDIYDGKLLEENKLEVVGYFSAPDYPRTKVKVRYRGFGSNHWNAHQRSYLVKFPKDNLYRGMKSLNLTIAYDRGYYAELLAGYRAKQFGIVTPELKFIRLRLNGGDNGVYLAVEQWSEQWLAHNALAENDSLFTTTKTADESLYYEQSLYHLVGQKYWKDYTINTDQTPLYNLANLVENADNAAFARYIPELVDMEQFYKWAAINLLAGSFHQSDGTTVLRFDRAQGRFVPVPWDVNHYYLNENYFSDSDTLTKRILSVPEFYGQFRALMLAYVNDPENLAAELAFYDQLAAKLKPEFYADRVKFHNDRTFLFLTNRLRDMVVANFARIPELLPERTPLAYQPAQPKPIAFTGSFSYLPAVTANPAQFAAAHPQFQLPGRELVLPPGSHYFSGNTVIPRNTALMIRPGARLVFAPGASLIAYSPIIANGSQANPINFVRANPAAAWGVVAINGTPGQSSSFTYANFSGGSASAEINGVVYTGMLTAHYADIKVTASTFTDDLEDDALNVKYSGGSLTRSYFTRNNGDAFDLDASVDFLVADNTFMNNGRGLVPGHTTKGDAVDISFSRPLIRGNTVLGAGDKCISVGERSQPRLTGNVLIGCDYGVAVKDDSDAYLEDNLILNNRIGLGLYRKKPDFAVGGRLTGEKLTLWGNQQAVSADILSNYVLKNSTVEGGAAGENIIDAKPDLRALLPAALWPRLPELFK